MTSRRVNVKAILADAELRRKLMVSTIQTTQAREGIDTSPEQAARAYYVVTEAERAAFFELEKFKGDKRGEPDCRHEMFVRALRGEATHIRHDVARRDFGAIEGHPLAYERMWIVAPIFREAAPLEPAFAHAKLGAHTSDDERLVRCWWEVDSAPSRTDREWLPFAKGGSFARFYADIYLRVAWDPTRKSFFQWFGRAGRPTERPEALDYYFRPGLTWPLAGSDFGVRFLPEGCVFAHKGPAIIPNHIERSGFLAGVINSAPAEFLIRTLISRKDMGGRWEVGVVKRVPIPQATAAQADEVSRAAHAIHDAKRHWDEGNETSTAFVEPWVLRTSAGARALSDALDHALAEEAAGEALIRQQYAQLNDEAYNLYGIPDATRTLIEASLGERPQEALWPQMGGESLDQKRMEHVWRMLSYAVKRVVEADDDGIVPFGTASGEARLGERVRHELAQAFPSHDESRLEAEIANELRQAVRNYRRCQGIDEWLEDVFFEYHASLYRRRPIFWHIASSQGSSAPAFGALVHYRRFDKNRMAKLRASYVRDAIEELRREVGIADKAGRTEDRTELQSKLEEVQALDKKLQQIQEGHHDGVEGGERDFRILTPWKDAAKRPRGWMPDLDDGVKVNIAPFERAGVLRVRGLVG